MFLNQFWAGTAVKTHKRTQKAPPCAWQKPVFMGGVFIV